MSHPRPNPSLTLMREIEKARQFLGRAASMSRIGEAAPWLSKLVKERVHHRLDSGEPLGWRVLEQKRYEIYGIGTCFAEYLSSELASCACMA